VIIILNVRFSLNHKKLQITSNDLARELENSAIYYQTHLPSCYVWLYSRQIVKAVLLTFGPRSQVFKANTHA